MKKYYYTLDLKKNEQLKKEYIDHHKNVWPEIIKSIKDSGIKSIEIYNLNYRLFMVMETDNNFNEKDKKKSDLNNPKVQEWESLMWKYQMTIPNAKKGEKWVRMNKIFDLNQICN